MAGGKVRNVNSVYQRTQVEGSREGQRRGRARPSRRGQGSCTGVGGRMSEIWEPYAQYFEGLSSEDEDFVPAARFPESEDESLEEEEEEDEDAEDEDDEDKEEGHQGDGEEEGHQGDGEEEEHQGGTTRLLVLHQEFGSEVRRASRDDRLLTDGR